MPGHKGIMDKLAARNMSGRSAFETLAIIEGSLEVKLPTIWTVEKQR